MNVLILSFHFQMSQKEEREICEFEMDFSKKSFCCCFNLSNDGITS